MTVDGTVRFARFAYPPNALGYCGPNEDHALFACGSGGRVESDLTRLARQFDGAWPYLELIAASEGIDDPLDVRVVDAYWLGGDLSAGVDAARFERGLGEFRERTDWSQVVASIGAGGAPTHAFHVFSVYPWVGLLRRGIVDEPLRVLDRCRIRWGRLVASEGDRATVRSRPLVFRDGRLGLGAPRAEVVRLGDEGASLIGDWAPGDWVALHWDWVCDGLDAPGLAAVRAATNRELELVNRDLERAVSR